MATTTDDAALKPDPAILAKVKPAPFERRPLVENQRDYAWITDKICRIVEEKLQHGGGFVLLSLLLPRALLSWVLFT